MKNTFPPLPGRSHAASGPEFSATPRLTADQPGYEWVLRHLDGDGPFTFCKTNHGFWERLARLERNGVDRSQFETHDGADIDRLLGIAGSRMAEGGMLSELLGWMREKPDLDRGLCFVPSLEPWPFSDRIEGTPFENRAVCESLIRHFVPEQHLTNLSRVGFSGHEFKVSVITGGVTRFVAALEGRHVIAICNAQNRAFIEALSPASVDVILVDAKAARESSEDIRARLFDAIAAQQGAPRPPVVLAGAGGMMTTWLGMQAWERFARLHFVDLGGAMAAFHPATAKTNWIKIYGAQMLEDHANTPFLKDHLLPALGPNVTGHDPRLVAHALRAGVPEPAGHADIPVPAPASPIPFIENKAYDHDRMRRILSLSVRANHHANGGPVVGLLEGALGIVTGQPATRAVVAVSSGTTALHLACGWHQINNGATRWVTSAFNFFSAGIGPLANTQVLDCDADGRFDLAALKALPRDSYDGVVYTNVFARQSDWDDVASFCREAGKAFVVDNATGLLDRPASALSQGAPIEAVSAHHTKPWGVGEGGFVLCDTEQADTIRNMANFSARLPSSTVCAAQNGKLSDLAAAAIYARLERMPRWSPFYISQERRMRSLMVDLDLDIEPLGGAKRTRSPRAHTPFIAPGPVDINAAQGPVTIRKYYRPLRSALENPRPTPIADALFARIFSLSNAPEMRLVANEDIIAQVRSIVAGAK